jgi:predicted Zn-dependent protease
LKHHTAMVRAISFFLAALLLLSPASAQLPALGDGLEMTTSMERRLGDRIARELYRDPDYIDDPVLGDYVQGIWLRLMAAARLRGELSPELDERFAWRIALGRDKSVNAFALPGGYLGVHLGLIAVVSSEDELASVLAHELSHVTQRHISRLMTRQDASTPWLIGSMLLGVLAARGNPNVANALITGGQAAAIQGQLNFSRDMEREADRVGYGILTQADFDPQGFVTMFEKLQKASRLNDSGSFPYLRSHPMTTERIADMQGRQQLLERPAGPLGMTLQHALVAARARALTNPGVDVYRAWVQEGLQVLALQPISNMKSNPDVPRSAAQVYAASLAAARLRDIPQAARFHRYLAELTQADASAARLVRFLGAELALMAGDPRRAAALLSATGDFATDTQTRSGLFLWATAMTGMGQSAEAVSRLQTWVQVRPQDAQAWQLLASAYLTQGKQLSAIRAEAEMFASRLDFVSATNRLKAAQDIAKRDVSGQKVDYIELSIIDARTRAFEQLLREQQLER